MSVRIYELTPAEALVSLGTSEHGLTAAEAASRRLTVGTNELRARHRYPWVRQLLRQFTNFFAVLLLAAAALCVVADLVQPGEDMDTLGAALAIVAVLNALFSFAQEFRAERAMAALRGHLGAKATDIRDWDERVIDARDVVPGDLIVLSEGEHVPADARVLSGHGLMVNNAPLTGESGAVDLGADAVASSIRLTDAPNVVRRIPRTLPLGPFTLGRRHGCDRGVGAAEWGLSVR